MLGHGDHSWDREARKGSHGWKGTNELRGSRRGQGLLGQTSGPNGELLVWLEVVDVDARLEEGSDELPGPGEKAFSSDEKGHIDLVTRLVPRSVGQGTVGQGRSWGLRVEAQLGGQRKLADRYPIPRTGAGYPSVGGIPVLEGRERAHTPMPISVHFSEEISAVQILIMPRGETLGQRVLVQREAQSCCPIVVVELQGGALPLGGKNVNHELGDPWL